MTTAALRRQVKNIVHNYSEAEIKVPHANPAPPGRRRPLAWACSGERQGVSVDPPQVREATSNDPWGPSSSLMSEIADLTFNVVAFAEVMGMVWKRLNDSGKNWRHVYKVRNVLVAFRRSARSPANPSKTSCRPSGPDSAGLPAEDGLRASGSAMLRECLHHPGTIAIRSFILQANMLKPEKFPISSSQLEHGRKVVAPYLLSSCASDAT